MKLSFAVALSLVVLPTAVSAQKSNVAPGVAANCSTCHGTNGNSAGGVPPSLAGRDRNELLQTLKDFQSGKRPSTIMQQQAKGYTDRELEMIAAYYAAQKAAPARMPSKP